MTIGWPSCQLFFPFFLNWGTGARFAQFEEVEVNEFELWFHMNVFFLSLKCSNSETVLFIGLRQQRMQDLYNMTICCSWWSTKKLKQRQRWWRHATIVGYTFRFMFSNVMVAGLIVSLFVWGGGGGCTVIHPSMKWVWLVDCLGLVLKTNISTGQCLLML